MKLARTLLNIYIYDTIIHSFIMPSFVFVIHAIKSRKREVHIIIYYLNRIEHNKMVFQFEDEIELYYMNYNIVHV